jgi:predicted nucleic acid-binding protein
LRRSLSRLVVWPYTNDAAAQFGRVIAELRRMGRPMQQIDIMVAAVPFRSAIARSSPATPTWRRFPG